MIKKIYILTVVAAMFSSCSDFLDRLPQDQLSPSSFWKTEADAKLAVVGCYSLMESNSTPIYWDAASDNAFSFHRFAGWQVFGNGAMTPGESQMKSFLDYKAIHACNEYLENENKINFSDDKVKTFYSSEVRFIRAYNYFTKVCVYGDVPFYTVNFKTPEEAKVKRTDREVVEQFIIDELSDIAEKLPTKAEAGSPGRISQGAAYQLLSRLYLYRGEYDNALKAAKMVKGYELYHVNGNSGFDNYNGLFLVANQDCDEYILNLENTENTHPMSFITWIPNSHGGWSGVVPLQSLVDSYKTKDGLTIEEAKANGTYDPTNPFVNRDPRLRATIIYPGQNWENKIFRSVDPSSPDHPSASNNATHSGYNFKKFYNSLTQFSLGFENTAKSIPLMRYAETLLTIAECKIELNQIDEEVYSCLNQLRRRVDLPEVDRDKYKNQSALRELVRRERRVELAGEGLRRADIIRWGIAKDVLNGSALGCNQGIILEEVSDPVFGDLKVKLDGAPFVVEQRVYKEHNNLFPIPLTEIDNNPNLLPNNPGY